jgi:hypothetical protein
LYYNNAILCVVLHQLNLQITALPSPTTTYLGPKCPNTLASIQDNNTTCLHQVQTTEDITAGANQSSHVVHHGSSCIQHQVQAITANLQNSNNQQQGSV